MFSKCFRYEAYETYMNPKDLFFMKHLSTPLHVVCPCLAASLNACTLPLFPCLSDIGQSVVNDKLVSSQHSLDLGALGLEKNPNLVLGEKNRKPSLVVH